MIALNTPYTSYQLSAVGVGAIATGLEDIRQCIDFILRTIPGSDPFRPLFGSNVYRWLDSPVTVAVPNMKKEIYEALDLWEKRIVLSAITHVINQGVIEFTISYRPIDEDFLDQITWSINGVVSSGGSVSGIILSALIPAKVAEGTYNVTFMVDDAAALPVPPAYGFSSAPELLSWVSANWFNYGTWYLAGDKLVVYLKSGIAKKATLLVTQKAVLVKKAFIPQLSGGDFYHVSLIADGDAAVPAFPGNINTLEGMLLWLMANWADYGTWQIESNGSVISPGEFSEDFSDDFDIGGVIADRFLVLQTDKFSSVTLTFI